MKQNRRNARKIAVRAAVLAVLIGVGGGCGVLYKRACPKWQAADLNPEIRETKESPYCNPAGMTQETRLIPPAGYERIPAAEGSFLAFMREQPLYPDGAAICSYTGAQLSGGAAAAAVYTLSVGQEGYQECADSVIRLWSEYFMQTGQTERIAFGLTNGYQTDYESWRDGKRVIVLGDMTWSMKLAGYDDSEQQLHNYLVTVIRYAGTRSLEAESETIPVSEAHAGDLLVKGGSPGHAVLIVDEAVNAAGERCFLLAQGAMPAQNCHIPAGSGGNENPWYTEEQLVSGKISFCGYTFQSDALRRWKEGFPNAQAE